MALTIANWTISVRLFHATPTHRASDDLTHAYRRQQMNNEVARTREHAYSEWMLMGGSTNR